MAQGENQQEDDSTVLPVLIDLRNRAQALLTELESFREHIRRVRQEGQIEIAHFRSTVQSEFSMLDRLAKKPEGKSTIHIARSSNLPFLETIWSTAKKSNHLLSLHKRVYYESPLKSLSQNLQHVSLGSDKGKGTGKKNSAVIVDTITDRGLVWTKISLVTNNRLLFDLAKQGWVSGSDDEGEGAFPDMDEDSDVPLVKNTRELCFASRSFRTRTKTPVVHLVLPRVQPGQPEVDEILEQCRAMGAVVFCGEDLQPVPPLERAMNMMVPDPLSEFSDELNIDCTILLALVSEFSHAKVSKESWFHVGLKRQVEIEGNQNLLPSLLYPALASHKLVCTKEAAKRMREIVDTIGTPSEKARTAILLGDDKSKTREDLIKDMQEWSTYHVSEELQLPVEVVDQNENDCHQKLPEEGIAVGGNLTPINQSVFLYGWANGKTTITSNRSVVKQIENDLEKFDDLDETVWPKVWLCPTARSLVGKEKRGFKKEEGKDSSGAWPLPDPLRREEQRRNGLDVLSTREGHEVEDRRPNGYPCDDVIAAKNAARQEIENGTK